MTKRLGDFGYRERIEKLEERVLKLENPLHMPLVKLHERIDKLEEQVAGLRRATEGHFGMVHERIAKLEETTERLVSGHRLLDDLRAKAAQRACKTTARLDKLEDRLDVMRNWQGWAENNVLCGHACRIETLEDRIEALEKGLNERIAEHWRALEKYGHVT